MTPVKYEKIMIIKFKNISKNPAIILRSAGYIFQQYTADKKMSFIRPLSRNGFPRFHIYAQTKNRSILINIHLDQRKNTYGKSIRHHGKYDGEILQNEAKRIISIIK